MEKMKGRNYSDNLIKRIEKLQIIKETQFKKLKFY